MINKNAAKRLLNVTDRSRFLKFLGDGGCCDKTNSTAYREIGEDTLLIIDAGIKNIDGILKLAKHKKRIIILITHCHVDHVGGLPTILYELKKRGKVENIDIVARKETKLEEYMSIVGCPLTSSKKTKIILRDTFTNEIPYYEFEYELDSENKAKIMFQPVETHHVPTIKSFGFLITYVTTNIHTEMGSITKVYYSGDSNCIPIDARCNMHCLDEFYQDVNYGRKNPVHMHITDLYRELTNFSDNTRVFGYHNSEGVKEINTVGRAMRISCRALGSEKETIREFDDKFSNVFFNINEAVEINKPEFKELVLFEVNNDIRTISLKQLFHDDEPFAICGMSGWGGYNAMCTIITNPELYTSLKSEAMAKEILAIQENDLHNPKEGSRVARHMWTESKSYGDKSNAELDIQELLLEIACESLDVVLAL